MSDEVDSADDWYTKITDDERMPGDWKSIMIGSESRRDALRAILKSVFKEMRKETLRPDPLDIFAFCRYTSLRNIRVVIIGQDPYPNEHACGLCFSSTRGIPKSFTMIQKALIKQKCIPTTLDTADLRGWAYQGVLLLNTSFTTLNGETKTHSAAWQPYTDLILKRLVKYLDERPGLFSTCWLLWGGDAQAKKHIIESNSPFGKNIIMEWGHPSTMANHNKDEADAGNFAKCDHFLRVVKITKQEWGFPLYWDAIEQDVECFTDGSAKPNKTSPDARAGYAVVFSKGPLKGLTIAGQSNNKTKAADGKPQYTNNIRAEGEALREAFRALLSLPSDMWETFKIVLDCEFYKNLLTSYIPGWLEKDQKFEEHKNPDLNTDLWKMYRKLIGSGKTIIIEHMKSHKKKPDKKQSREYHLWFWNNYVDIVASHARQFLTLEESPQKSFSYLREYFTGMDISMKDKPAKPESGDEDYDKPEIGAIETATTTTSTE